MLDYVKYLYQKFLIQQQVGINSCQNIQVIFKADDLSNFNKKIKRFDCIVQKENICVSWGIIGNSLENPSKNYVDFLKNKSSDKHYHFFNHGYYHLGGQEGYEFEGKSIDTQVDFLKATQDIVKEKVGIVLDTFGAPCNHIDDNTSSALDEITEIKWWYYGNTNNSKINIRRTIEIEDGVGNPNFEFFKRNFEDLRDNHLLTLQIHPNAWSKASFLEFILCVKYLKKCGCNFINPSNKD